MDEQIYTYLFQRSPKLCSFATASKDGKTELSVMGYAIKENLTIILSTKSSSRKIRNLKENPHASFVVGWDFTEKNIQIDGVATIIETGTEYREVESFFYEQNQAAAKFKSSETVFIQFIPNWIRVTDTTVSPPNVTEKELS